MSTLKVYFDLMSQPSRALILFLEVNNIPYEPKPVALRKGEHMTEEYKKINPFQRVPVIDDGGFLLTESVAILRYLSDKYHVADHWYPRDLQKRARVDEYMAWQHFNTRLSAASVFRIQAILRYLCVKYQVSEHWYPCGLQARARVDEYLAWHHLNTSLHADAIYDLQIIEPRAMNKPVNQEKLRRFQIELENSLNYIETVFLKDQPFLTGHEISIADLLGICELIQPYAANQDVREGRPVLAAWMERVKERLQPHFDEATKVLYAVRSNFLKSQSRM